MSSFIYQDKNLIEQLISIAQQTVPQPTQPKSSIMSQQDMNQSALELIKNLRAQVSAVKANSNPTFSDLETLENFRNWAKQNNASNQGVNLVNNDRFDLKVLQTFLSDMRERFSSNPEFSESIANLIDQANKAFKALGLKIPLYTPEKKNEPATNDKDKAHLNHNLKIDNDLLEKSDQTPNQTSQNSGLPQQKLNALRENLQLLDENTIDFDEIVSRSRQLLNFIGSNMNGKLHTYLTPAVNSVEEAGRQFHQATTRTPNAPAIPASRNEVSIQRSLESNFRGYNGQELATISRSYHDLMNDVNIFFASCKKAFQVQGINFDELDKQMSLANIYSTIFFNVSNQFLATIKRDTSGLQAKR